MESMTDAHRRCDLLLVAAEQALENREWTAFRVRLMEFRSALLAHFAAEEEVLVPVLPDALASRLVDEHAAIRRATQELAAHPTREAAVRLGKQLHAHVRFEEREAFPLLESTLSPAELARIAERLADSPDP